MADENGEPQQPTPDIPGVSQKMMHIGTDLMVPVKMCQEVTLITGTRGQGKCLDGDSKVLLSCGLEVPIKDLDKYPNEMIVCLGPELKLVPVKGIGLTSRKVKKMLEIITRSGRRIKLTPEHPLLDITGWRPASTFGVGEMLATPRRTEFFGDREMKDSEVKILAYMLAEGGLTGRGCVFTNIDPVIQRDFDRAITEFDTRMMSVWNKERTSCQIVSEDYRRRVNRTMQKCVVDGCSEIAALRDYCEYHYYKYKNSEKFIAKSHTFVDFMERMGIRGKLSVEKVIPDCVFQLPKRQLAVFLNRLFSCDGTINDDDDRVIEYYSSSEVLIRQVLSLLLRFGIIGRIRYKKAKCDNKDFDSWRLTVSSESEVVYLREIGFIGERAEKATAVLSHMLSTSRNPNLDVLPLTIWDLVRKECKARGVSTRELGRRYGVKPQAGHYECADGSIGTYYRSNPPGGFGVCRPSREKVEKIATILGSSQLLRLAQSDVYWDEIKSVKELNGDFTVYDIGVPEFHNFVAENFIVHNSWTVGVFLEEMHKNGINVILLDALGAHRKIRLPGVDVLDLKMGQTINADKMVERLMTTNKSYIVNMMDLFDPKKQQAIVADVCIKLLTADPASHGKVVVTIIEEAEEFAPAGTAKYVFQSIIPLNRLTKLGRARGCGVMFVTQRPQDMSAKLRSQASNFITHRLTNYTELDIIKKQLVAASRGDTTPIVQKIFGFKPGEALILSTYVPDGLAFTKIRPRETQHAGVNVLGEGERAGESVVGGGAAGRPSFISGIFGGSGPTATGTSLPSSAASAKTDGIIESSGMTSDDSFDNVVSLAFLALMGATGYILYNSYQKKRSINFDKGEADLSAYREIAFKEPEDKKEKTKESQPEDVEKLDMDSMLALGRKPEKKKLLFPPDDAAADPFGYSPFEE